MDIARLMGARRPEDVISCNEATSVREAVQLLATKRIGAVPVLRDGGVVGIFSERDVLYRLAQDGAACLDRTVGDVMTAPPITVEPRTSCDEAMALMTRRRIRHLPVLDGTRLVGFISIGDIVKSRIDAAEAEAEQMRIYIQSA
jgi:CBS domain-containing protein